MENFDHIIYFNCPHFTIGRVDQWGEHGYLLYEDKVYWYEEDRKDQCSNVRSPMPVKDFLTYAEAQQISIPDSFMEKLRASNN